MAEQPPFQFDVYISYRSTHKQFVVGELLPRLRSAEISVFVDTEQLQGGDIIDKKLEDGVRASRILLIVLTKNYAESPYLQRERELFLELIKDDQRRKIIPIVLEDGPIPTEINFYFRVDFRRRKNWKELIEALRADTEGEAPESVIPNAPPSIKGQKGTPSQVRGPTQQPPVEQSTSEVVQVNGQALSDVPSKQDLLGYRDYVEALANFIESPKTSKPLTIGIDAAWGGGKTTLMHMLEERLGGGPKPKWWQRLKDFLITVWNTRRVPVNSPRFFTVWFNAWSYNHEEALWAAMALEIWSQARQKINWWKRTGLALTLNAKRFDWGKFGLDLVKALLLSAALAALAVLAFAGLSLWLGQDSAQTFDWLQNYVKAFAGLGLATLTYTVFKDVAGLLFSPFSAGITRYIREPDYASKIGFIREFQRDFKFVVESVTQNGKWPLAVFIDDLDRCTPDKAAEVIEAINLLLDSAYCIFVIGMDSTMLSRSIQAKYKDIQPYFEDIDFTSRIGLGRHFLEKIIQIDFRIPRPDKGNMEKFVLAQLGRSTPTSDSVPKKQLADAESFIQAEQRAGKSLDEAREIVQEEHPDLQSTIQQAAQSVKERAFEELSEVESAINDMAPYLGYNPRRIKRFINMYRLQALIAYERHILESIISLDNLARWVVINMRWPEFIDAAIRDSSLLPRIQTDLQVLAKLKDKPKQTQLDKIKSETVYSITLLPLLTNREFSDLLFSIRGEAKEAQSYLHLLNLTS